MYIQARQLQDPKSSKKCGRVAQNQTCWPKVMEWCSKTSFLGRSWIRQVAESDGVLLQIKPFGILPRIPRIPWIPWIPRILAKRCHHMDPAAPQLRHCMRCDIVEMIHIPNPLTSEVCSAGHAIITIGNMFLLESNSIFHTYQPMLACLCCFPSGAACSSLPAIVNVMTPFCSAAQIRQLGSSDPPARLDSLDPRIRQLGPPFHMRRGPG